MRYPFSITVAQSNYVCLSYSAITLTTVRRFHFYKASVVIEILSFYSWDLLEFLFLMLFESGLKGKQGVKKTKSASLFYFLLEFELCGKLKKLASALTLLSSHQIYPPICPIALYLINLNPHLAQLSPLRPGQYFFRSVPVLPLNFQRYRTE